MCQPNAVATIRIGEVFRSNFLASVTDDRIREIPLGFPIRFLSGLAEGMLAPNRPPAPVATVVGLVDVESLLDPTLDMRSKIADLVAKDDLDGRVIVALIVYQRVNASAPRPSFTGTPWNRVAILWIDATFQEFFGLAQRTRYEWLPGPSFFLVEFGGDVRSWRFPWDPWQGFVRDVRDQLEKKART